MKSVVTAVLLLLAVSASATTPLEDLERSAKQQIDRAQKAPLIDPQARYPDMSDAEAKDTSCAASGQMFEGIAYNRDLQMSPEIALAHATKNLRGGKFPISFTQAKNAVNLVYFDPAFSSARGSALNFSVRELCLNDWKPKFRPLK